MPGVTSSCCHRGTEQQHHWSERGGLASWSLHMAQGVQQRTKTQREVLFLQNAYADVQRFNFAGKVEKCCI